MTTLVTGASGNIGSRLVATLAGSSHPVRGSSRDATSLRLPAGVELAELDLADPGPSAAKVLRGVETVFLYPVIGTVEAFVAAAVDAGVQYVVLLSSPAAYEVGEFDRPIGQIHRGIERAVAESGLSHTVLYPSWLATNTRRGWADQIQTSGRVAMAFADAPITPIHPDDIAEVAAHLLTQETFRSRMQILTGPEPMRLRDAVAIIGDVLGADVTVEDVTREEALDLDQGRIPRPILETLLDVAAATIGQTAPVTNTVERITGHPARSLRSWLEAHRSAFQRGCPLPRAELPCSPSCVWVCPCRHCRGRDVVSSADGLLLRDGSGVRAGWRHWRRDERWRRGMIAKVLTDLAVSLALGGAALPTSRCCAGARPAMRSRSRSVSDSRQYGRRRPRCAGQRIDGWACGYRDDGGTSLEPDRRG
ncbi:MULTISPECIES: NAD(P)H-binding protein [unclassified Frankia]